MQTPYQKNGFSRLRIYYLLALSTIALSIIIGQLLVQRHLHRQESDARVINIAGRQRMLSQQISKLSLALLEQPPSKRNKLLTALRLANIEWYENNRNLKNGNDSLLLPILADRDIELLFKRNDVFFDSIWNASSSISSMFSEKNEVDTVQLKVNIHAILRNEEAFLMNMDAIVSRFEYLASNKIAKLKHTEYFLLVISLSIILLEILFIFLPTTRRVNETLLKLIRSEHDAQQMSKEISALYASLEASYERISGITLPVAPPKLIAKTDRGGNVIYVAEYYQRDFLDTSSVNHYTIAHLFGFDHEAADDFNEQLIDVVANEQNWHKELVYQDKIGDIRYMDIYVVPIYNEQKEVDGLHVLAADFTPRRLAEQDMYKKDRAEIEKKINEQKFRSVLVLEGQEEERKRIAMNIHDGIGQMLTSLKFHLASIDLKDTGDAARKLADIDILTKEVIQEVRRVTFNLKPPVLSDYGLVAGLKNLVQEIDRLSEINVTFENHGHFNTRLSSKVENNIYRIVQEAINNAIKYSRSENVEVIIEEEESTLLVVVRDYGIGFEPKQVDLLHVDYGHGFLNMQERAAYINGKLRIESKKGIGTIVKLFVPLVTKPEDT